MENKKLTNFKDIDNNTLKEGDIFQFINPNDYSGFEPIAVKFDNLDNEFVAYNPECCNVCKYGNGGISELNEAIEIGGKFKIIGNIFDN